MAKSDRSGLDAPLGRGATRQRPASRDRFGRFTEWVARAMGTPTFLAILTLFCALWMVYTVVAEQNGWWRFDSAALGFTALTLILSLQASYAAPLILLAQNRQDDRDRVQIEQDRQRSERNLADTEYLAREIVALRMALEERNSQAVTRDVLRQELRALLADLEDEHDGDAPADTRTGPVSTRPRRTRP
ncbi:DUF1003 domain-containing protein [Microbacterium abyssi]|uniref:DUF1003 domain-containing protein n=1 Tax=Microbacterium abyssi TaxID=2782166 RepID=UPI001887DB5C|nr:DUF1003 domain-containing protein [Microbacterium sp. A18JL241]